MFIIIPTIYDEELIEELDDDVEVVREHGELVVFKADDSEWDDVEARLMALQERGKFDEFILIHQELLDDALPIRQYQVSRSTW